MRGVRLPQALESRCAGPPPLQTPASPALGASVVFERGGGVAATPEQCLPRPTLSGTADSDHQRAATEQVSQRSTVRTHRRSRPAATRRRQTDTSAERRSTSTRYTRELPRCMTTTPAMLSPVA